MNSEDRPIREFSDEEFLKISDLAQLFIEKGATEPPPKFVIIAGGVGAGKTTMRRQNFKSGYVNFDFGEIFNAVKKEFGEANPRLSEYATLASTLILSESLAGQKNLVIEIIGDNKAWIETVMNKMKELGYEISLQFIHCDPQKAYQRHVQAVQEDTEYISAYFTQEATLAFFYQQLELGEMPLREETK